VWLQVGDTLTCMTVAAREERTECPLHDNVVGLWSSERAWAQPAQPCSRKSVVAEEASRDQNRVSFKRQDLIE
jgi:hypothetical protein